MGFFIDIAEIAGLLFVAYVAGWFAGYLAHRLTARAPGLEAAPAARPLDTATQPATDALVKAPIVVPVASNPPPVIAAASAIEPVRATAIPDSAEAAPPIEQPAVAPPPVVSGIDRLKSLSTAMPLMPASVAPAPIEEQPSAQFVAVAESLPAGAAEDVEPGPAIEATDGLTVSEPVLPEPPAPVEQLATPVSTVEAPVVIADEPTAVAPQIAAQPAPLEPEPTPPPQPARSTPATGPISPAAPGAPIAPPVAPITPVPPAATATPSVAPSAVPATGAPARVKQRIRVAPATRAGETAAHPVDPPPMPASAPGMPWAGAIKGQEAQKFDPAATPATPELTVAPEAEDPIPEPDAALDVALLSSIADQLKLAPDLPGGNEAETPPAVEPPAAPTLEQPEVAANEPASAQPGEALVEPAAAPPQETAQPAEPEAASVQTPTPPPRRPTLDEDAAMRAIEGGWSRRDVRALGDAPELTDVTAAVSAAQVAVEQVLARNGVDAAEPDARAQASFGKPVGLPQPRDGRRDNFKRIDGLGPLDEVTLNNLGIYHFDQIAKWTEREVLWLENHAFAVGRIGREGWQDQARELLAERDATRALR